MRRMRHILILLLVMLPCFSVSGSTETRSGAATAPGAPSSARVTAKDKHPNDEAAALELKRAQLAEKEAALTAKEQEIQRVEAKLAGRIKELEEAKRSYEATVAARKKAGSEQYQKMLKMFKTMKSAEAAALMNKLDEDVVIEMLNRMDQKTVLKLMPDLSQPRVLRWVKENIKDAPRAPSDRIVAGGRTGRR